MESLSDRAWETSFQSTGCRTQNQTILLLKHWVHNSIPSKQILSGLQFRSLETSTMLTKLLHNSKAVLTVTKHLLKSHSNPSFHTSVHLSLNWARARLTLVTSKCTIFTNELRKTEARMLIENWLKSLKTEWMLIPYLIRFLLIMLKLTNLLLSHRTSTVFAIWCQCTTTTVADSTTTHWNMWSISFTRAKPSHLKWCS